MEDELGALGHGLLAQFVREDLVEILRIELIVLVAFPHPDLGVHALDVLLLLILLLILSALFVLFGFLVFC